jgi:uncharacterized Zn finger protein (UPF0148 family)
MDKEEVTVFCPSCGFKFNYLEHFSGRVTGGVGGAAAGAILGAKVGIAMGPLGAIAGTLPGAILGSVFGKDLGKKIDNPICPSCQTKFELPSNLKKKITDLLVNNQSKTAGPTIPDEVNQWIIKNMYYELAKYLVKKEKGGQTMESKKIMGAIRNSNSSLAKKVEEVKRDLLNRMR